MSKKIVVPVVLWGFAVWGTFTIPNSVHHIAKQCISEKSHELLTDQCKQKLANLV